MSKLNKETIYKILCEFYDNEIPLNNFSEISQEFANHLKYEWYISIFNPNNTILITEKWKIFLQNYDNSKSKKLDTYLWKYPNISKLFYSLFWIIIWIIWTIVTLYIKSIIN